MSTETFLVLCATGRQGSAVIDALIANNVKSIVGSSRNPASLAAKRGESRLSLSRIEGICIYICE